MPTTHVISLLRVSLGGAVIGLPALAVAEMVRAVAIAPVDGAPPIIEGVIDVRGTLVAVVDLRRRLGFPPIPLDPAQFLVVLQVGRRMVAVRVDDVDDLLEVDADAIRGAEGLSPVLRGLAGIGATPDGIVVIHDPESFLTAAEAASLDAALALRP